MKIISNKNKLIKIIQNEKNLGFIPTMGAIHSGHISLIKKSINQCNRTIVSIFINNPQFNKKSDFKKYPKDFERDKRILKKIKVDYLYLPKSKQIYPNGPNKNIKVDSFSKKLCGKSRPGHFAAVVDVIDRFLKIIKPNKIYFGEKDMQQLKIIEQYIKKNYKKTKVVPCKTIREKSGIAYSSRNLLLSKRDKFVASKIFKFLIKQKRNLIAGHLKLSRVKKIFYNFGVKKIEYIEILNINKLIKPYKKKNKYKIFIAYYIGSTRLIDNV